MSDSSWLIVFPVSFLLIYLILFNGLGGSVSSVYLVVEGKVVDVKVSWGVLKSGDWTDVFFENGTDVNLNSRVDGIVIGHFYRIGYHVRDNIAYFDSIVRVD